MDAGPSREGDGREPDEGEGEAHTDYGSGVDAESDFATDEEDALGGLLEPADLVADLQQRTSAPVRFSAAGDAQAAASAQRPRHGAHFDANRCGASRRVISSQSIVHVQSSCCSHCIKVKAPDSNRARVHVSA
jgi:hypothetical protein